MADNVLSFETRVDLGGLESGMDSAKDKVSSFGGNIKSAMAAAAQATQQLADAQIQLGAAAEAGNANAAAIIQEYQTQVDATNAAVARLSTTEQQETQAVRSSISTRMLATAEMRELGIATQGAGRLLGAYVAQFPALSTAIQAAFSGFALVAIGEIAVDVGKKIYDAFDLGGQRAKELAADILDVDTAFRHENDTLDLQIAKLEAEQAKLEHRPQNGIALTLIEAANEADHLAERLKALDDQESKTIEKMSGSFLQQLVLGQSQTGYENTMLQQHVKWIEQATTTEGQLNEEKSYANSLQTRMNELLKMQDEQYELAKNSESGRSTDYTNEIKAVQQLMDTQKQEQAVVQGNIALNKEQSVVNNEKGEKTSGGKTPQINRIQLLIEERNQELAIDKAFHEQIQAGFETDYRAQVEAYKKGEQADRERTEEFKKNQKDQADAAIAAANETHNLNLENINTAQAKSTTAQETALVKNPEQQLEALRAFHAQAQAENVRFMQQEIEIETSTGQLDKAREMQQQLNAIQRKGNLEWLQDTEKISIQVNQKYQQFVTTFNADFTRAFDGVINKTETAQQAFAKMFNQIETALANFVIKWVLQQAEMWAATAAASLTGNTALKTVNMAQIKMDAGVAAGNTFAAVSAIPIVGPALAPAAAFAAYGAVMAFEAFEQGGIVNGSHGAPVPIMAHAGERVLSAPQTQRFEQMVNGSPSSGGNNVNLHYSPNINAFDRTGFRSTLEAHASDIHDIVRQGLKSGALGRA